MNQKKSPTADNTKKINLPKTKIIGGSIVLGIIALATTAYFWLIPQPGSIEQIVPADTAFLLEINVADLFPSEETKAPFELEPIANSSLQRLFPDSTIDQLKPWIGSKIGVALLPENEFIVAASYRNKNKTKSFLQQFLLPDEILQEEKFEDLTLYTPQFSSQLTFTFHDGWFLIGSSKETLTQALTEERKLGNTPYYRSVAKSFPSQLSAHIFINSEYFFPLVFEGNQYLAKKPLLETMAQAIPAGGIALEMQEGKSILYSKIITKEGMFMDGKASRKSNKLVPQLAQFAAQDSLFFMNGIGLYEKYQHTKSFLSQLHPQFGIILDGVMRAETQKIFGEEFDFEEDFLAHTHGQYALILDFKDPLKPFTHFTLLTEFSNGSEEETQSHLQDIVQFAQGKFSPKVVEIELPDGTTRRELVAVDKDRMPLNEVKFENKSYFTVQDPESANRKCKILRIGIFGKLSSFSLPKKT
ncbi:DUF3352 domain-containing protein, partial [Candidatus Gracilibacteria bacterium]|nr:DUF3352 domain-containing protein [Candidatus Gracilibacteria bacterium]